MRNWIRRVPSMVGWKVPTFFASIASVDGREAEDRPVRVSVSGKISVSVDATAGLGMNTEDTEKLIA